MRPRNTPGLALLSSLALVGLGVIAAEAGTKAAKTGWSRVITVTRVKSEGPILQSVFIQVRNDGMADSTAAQMLKQLGDYIDQEIAERGVATLSVGMMVDTVEATHEAKWSTENASRLIIALQRDLDLGHRGETERLHGLIGRVRAGVNPDEILGEGATLKDEKRAPR
jgi:hypothetical protein